MLNQSFFSKGLEFLHIVDADIATDDLILMVDIEMAIPSEYHGVVSPPFDNTDIRTSLNLFTVFSIRDNTEASATMLTDTFTSRFKIPNTMVFIRVIRPFL
jgi:hypothetical protein